MRLADLVQHGKQANVKTVLGNKYYWDGFTIKDENGSLITSHYYLVIYDDWQLDATTLESVCKERGWELYCYETVANVLFDSVMKRVYCRKDFSPAKLAKMMDTFEGKEI